MCCSYPLRLSTYNFASVSLATAVGQDIVHLVARIVLLATTVSGNLFRRTEESFYASCLHCISTKGGQSTPRSFGHALHAEKPNEIIHFDFLYLGDCETGEVYSFIIKDDLPTYTWLSPAKDTDAETAAEDLLKWFAAFDVVPTWISDRASHFKNTLMSSINSALHCHHHITPPNTPQVNGTVERLYRKVLRCCRALLSEFRMIENKWPYVLPIIQYVLNHTKLASLCDRTPITVFKGLPRDNPLRLLVLPPAAKPTSLNQIRTLKNMKVSNALASLEQMNRDVAEQKTKHQELAIRRQNQKKNVGPANLQAGDFVLVARRIAKDGYKLKMQWLGPQKIIHVVSEWVYECQEFLNERVALIHANSLKYYSDSQLNVAKELLDAIDHNDIHYNVVLKLLDLRFNRSKKQYKVQVKLKGFDEEDHTWEPIQQLQEDIQDMLEMFLKNHQGKEKYKEQRTRYLGL